MIARWPRPTPTYHKPCYAAFDYYERVLLPYRPRGRRSKRVSCGLRITPTLDVDALQHPLIEGGE